MWKFEQSRFIDLHLWHNFCQIPLDCLYPHVVIHLFLQYCGLESERWKHVTIIFKHVSVHVHTYQLLIFEKKIFLVIFLETVCTTCTKNIHDSKHNWNLFYFLQLNKKKTYFFFLKWHSLDTGLKANHWLKMFQYTSLSKYVTISNHNHLSLSLTSASSHTFLLAS